MTQRALLFLVVVAAAASACTVSAAAQLGDARSAARRLLATPFEAPKLPMPVERRLPNGVRVFVLEDRRSPVVSFRIAIAGAGSQEDPAGSPGIAEAIVAALRQELRQDAAVASLLQRTSAALVASVAPGHTEISGAVLQTDFLDVMKAAARILTSPTFSAATFHKELTRIRSRYTPAFPGGGSLQTNTASTELLANTIFGRRMRQESEYVFANEQHRRRFQPAATVVGVTGDISPDEAYQVVSEAVEKWVAQDVTSESRGESDALVDAAPRAILVPIDGSPRLRITIAAAIAEQSTNAFYASEVWNAICYSRLHDKIRKQKGYVYYAPTAISGVGNRMLWSVFLDVLPEQAQAALEDVIAELEQLRVAPVPAPELQSRKNRLMAALPVRMKTSNELLELHMQRAMAGLPSEYWNTYPQRIARVTGDDVRDVAQRYLTRERLFVVAVGDPELAEPTLRKLFTHVAHRR